jgi:hypothetical protein
MQRKMIPRLIQQLALQLKSAIPKSPTDRDAAETLARLDIVVQLHNQSLTPTKTIKTTFRLFQKNNLMLAKDNIGKGSSMQSDNSSGVVEELHSARARRARRNCRRLVRRNLTNKISWHRTSARVLITSSDQPRELHSVFRAPTSSACSRA